MEGTLDQGLIYAIMALGVFLTYRILNFPDLTVDGSFVTGAGTAAVLITNGVNSYLATLIAFAAGCLAGLITAVLHTKAKIDALLASILTMIALYSINLRIMGGANIPLMKNTETVLSPLKNEGLLRTGISILIFMVLVLVIKLMIDWFLNTNFGLAVQSTGDNPGMAASFGISTDFAKSTTLMLANGLVALSGAIWAQHEGSADATMGTGIILIGLASVIVGNAILGTRYMFLATTGVILGSIVYWVVIFWALETEFLSVTDTKLISAILVVVALLASQSQTVRTWLGKAWPWRRDRSPEPLLDVPGSKVEEH